MILAPSKLLTAFVEICNC